MCKIFNKKINFNTEKVTSMSSMFYKCKNLNSKITLNILPTTDTTNMFKGCDYFSH